MNEVLVPLPLSDLIDRIICLRVEIEASDGADRRSQLDRQLQLLQRTAQRILPSDKALHDLSDAIFGLKEELAVLKNDLRRMEQQSDFGPGFVALARSCLALMEEETRLRSEIDGVLASHQGSGTPDA